MVVLQCALAGAYAVGAYTGLFLVREPMRTPAVVFIVGYHVFYVFYALVYTRRYGLVRWLDVSFAPFEVVCVTIAWLGEGSRESLIWTVYLYALFAYSRHMQGRRYLFTSALIMTSLVGGTIALELTAGEPWLNHRVVAVLLIGSATGFLANSMSTAWRTAEAKALELARIDPLTGIANRRTFFTEVGASSGANPGFGVLMLDLDNFKRLNDNHGHVEGDRALAQVAKILSEHKRTGDVVARYGGEEFVMFLAGANDGRARQVAERLRSVIETNTPVTVSIGCAAQVDNEAVEGVIRRADERLRLAKRTGKNRVLGDDGELEAA